MNTGCRKTLREQGIHVYVVLIEKKRILTEKFHASDSSLFPFKQSSSDCTAYKYTTFLLSKLFLNPTNSTAERKLN